MKRVTKCGKLAVILIVAFLIIPGVLTAQQFRAEGQAGLNLFSLSDPVFSATVDSAAVGGTADFEADLDHKSALQIGAYGGYDLGGIEIGAEVHFSSSGGDTNDFSVDGTTAPDTAGDYDFKYFKVGPVLRYYFASANPQIVPFAGAAVDYANATSDSNEEDVSLEISQGYLGIGLFGGANYWVQDNLYVGGMARVDYYTTISDDSVSVADFFGDPADFTGITSSGWMPLSIFFVVGTVF